LDYSDCASVAAISVNGCIDWKASSPVDQDHGSSRSLLLAFAAYAASLPEKTVLFERGKGDYLFYRIPGIVVTKRGTILAYAEARRSDRSDWGATDLILRRSTDGGKSWSQPALIGGMPDAFPKNPAAVAKKLGVGAGAGVTYDNPVAIAGRDGTIHFLFCVEYMRVYYMRSTDDGRTFSRPVEIPGVLKSPWVVLATGPGHGIELKDGRLLVPIWLSLGTGGGAHGDSVVSTLYSDDRGATWTPGDIAVPNNNGLTERDVGGSTGRWPRDAQRSVTFQTGAPHRRLQRGWRDALGRSGFRRAVARSGVLRRYGAGGSPPAALCRSRRRRP
jgi:hypothetical protein